MSNEEMIVAWAVRPPDGHLYVPWPDADNLPLTGSASLARAVADRCQRGSEEWSVEPLVPLAEVTRLRTDRDTMSRRVDEARDETAAARIEVSQLRAKIDGALAEHEHADTCQAVLSPDEDYPCNCWRAVLAEPSGTPVSDKP